jgi:hypothetical protein
VWDCKRKWASCDSYGITCHPKFDKTIPILEREMRLVHAQTRIEKTKLEKLMEKTKEKTIKDAIAKAVEHYLRCERKFDSYEES